MTRCAIFNQAPHSSEGTHTVTVRPLFVPGPEAGGSGGSGLYWFVCNLNPSLCIGLFLCHPPVSPASPSGAESLFFFSCRGESEVEAWGWVRDGWENLFGGTVNGCAGEAYTPILYTMRRNQPLPCPYPQTAVSDGPDNNTKGVEMRLWGRIFRAFTLSVQETEAGQQGACVCSHVSTHMI